jgi:hypothetical protein
MYQDIVIKALLSLNHLGNGQPPIASRFSYSYLGRKLLTTKTASTKINGLFLVYRLYQINNLLKFLEEMHKIKSNLIDQEKEKEKDFYRKYAITYDESEFVRYDNIIKLLDPAAQNRSQVAGGLYNLSQLRKPQYKLSKNKIISISSKKTKFVRKRTSRTARKHRSA